MRDYVMRVLLLTVIFVFTNSVYAGLYKWVDSEGNVHYSQKPPRDKQFKRLKAPPSAPENIKPLYKTTIALPEKNSAAAAEAEKNEKAQVEKCKEAKKNNVKKEISEFCN